jgi:starch synthase
LIDIQVHAFGEPRPSPLVAATYQPWAELAGYRPEAMALQVMSVDLAMAAGLSSAGLVHSHTWYTNFAGHMAKLLYRVPHVATTHSLEPLRPWKAEQLGGGYALSLFCERTGLEGADAIVAVSEGMAKDVLGCYPNIDPARVRVIHNGIDPDEFSHDPGTDVLRRLGLPTEGKTVVFVGRITRQKGLVHLLEAIPMVDPMAHIVLVAGAPDTPEIAAEVGRLVARVKQERGAVSWIPDVLARSEVIQILSHASVFVCPSIYEPFGLVNLEAMALEVPVVASQTGGIPEIVVDGGTGWLVPFERGDDEFGTPRDPAGFAAGLAQAINRLLKDPDQAIAFGQAGRRRVVERFSWSAIAAKTVDLYRELGLEVPPPAGPRPSSRKSDLT